MPSQTNLNRPPYFDDFSPNDNYHRVLFKPGYSLQARELTTLQSILQDQIERFSSRILKEGDNVVPGEFSVNTNVPYVRCSTITAGSRAKDFIGYTLTGVTSGVKAKVNFAEESTDEDDVTFFVTYTSSGTGSENYFFQEGEILESDTPDNYTAVVGVTNVSIPVNTPAMGFGSVFTITEGYYYVNGFMVRNDHQTISLDKYSNTPSYEIGFVVTEEFVTSERDTSLLDNAQGSSNFAAPGADRLKINLILSKRKIGAVDPNFILLTTVSSGRVLGKPEQTVKWDWLYDLLAQRTFEESGDYIVNEFPIQPLEYWNSEDVNGIFDPDPETLRYPAIPGSDNTDPITFEEADSLYSIRVDPGVAYVQGYRIDVSSPYYVYGNKPRDVSFRNNSLVGITSGPTIGITNVHGTVDIQNIRGEENSEAFDGITIYNNFIDGYVGESINELTEEPLNYGNRPWTTYHIITKEDIDPLAISIDGRVISIEKNSIVVSLNEEATPLQRGDFIGGAVILVSRKIEPLPAGIIHPRYFEPKRLIQGESYHGYNSTFDLGILTSSYFTRFLTTPEETNEKRDEDWTVGEKVFGEESGAFGIVESGSGNEVLILSNVVGEFIPGEEISQPIFEIGPQGPQGVQSIITEQKVSQLFERGEVFEFEFPDLTSTTIDLSGETVVNVTALGATLQPPLVAGGEDPDIEVTATSIRPTRKGRQRLLDFPYPKGTIDASLINYEVETFPSGIKGYAVIPTYQIQSSLATTKSLFSSLEGENDFSADLSIQDLDSIETINIANASLFSGVERTNYLSCDNFSGDVSDQLVTGDVVTFVDDEGQSVSKQVSFVTRPVGYGSQRSKSRIYFTTTLSNTVTGKTVQRIRARRIGDITDNLIFQLPQKVVKSLESDPINTQINYEVYRQFYVELTAGQNTVTITTNKTNEFFLPTSLKTSVFVSSLSESATPLVDIGIGRSLIIDDYLVEDLGRKVTFTLRDSFESDVIIKIISPIAVRDAKAKRKIFVPDAVHMVEQEQAFAEEISLPYTDVIEIKKIEMGGVDFIDVTDNYELDNGQRDNIYGLSRLILKPGRPKAIRDLFIEFTYFKHDNDGDFFSVDSYTHDDGVPYKDIPVYYSNAALPSQKKNIPDRVIELRDAIDFRPSVDTLNSKIPSIASEVDSQSALSFRDFRSGGNASVGRIPRPESIFESDIEFYLGKWDSLFIEKTGNLLLLEGTPAIDPMIPSDISTGIRLYDIYLPPYTFTVDNVDIRKYNYRRYRMKDIAKIDRRVDRLEDLVTLSLLEQSALNMNVRDSVTGLDRFKNGIVVDSFNDHSRGDTGNVEYRNSIDPLQSHLRSPFYSDQIKLEEVISTDDQRQNNLYVKNGSIVTLPYENVPFVVNTFATESINLQPFNTFTYEGNITLEPAVDTWHDDVELPRLVIEDNSVFDALQNQVQEVSNTGLRTIWGDWELRNTDRRNNSRRRLGSGFIQQSISNIRRRNNRRRVTNRFNEPTPPIAITEFTSFINESRNTTRNTNADTSNVVETSQGDRIVDVQTVETMRTIPVFISASRLKPNTRYYAFFDEINVSDWVSIDELSSDFSDGLSRYRGEPNSNPKGFGLPLLSDDTGNLSGVFLIPNGRPPVRGTTFNGNLSDVEYQTSGPTRQFNNGERTFRLTTSPSNSQSSDLDGFAETKFVASGTIRTRQETVVSTRIPELPPARPQQPPIPPPTIRDREEDTEDTNTRLPFIAGLLATGIRNNVEAAQRRQNEARRQQNEREERNNRDPVAQTFWVDSNFDEGVFVTELEVFFETKDETEGVEVYLTTTDAQRPTEVIIPFSRSTKNSDSILRVTTNLRGITSQTLKAGTVVVGQKSGARGVIKTDTTFTDEGIVYNVVLSNYLNEFVPGERIIPELTPEIQPEFTIVFDTVKIERIDLISFGQGYFSSGTSITFDSPELPGGVTAQGVVKVSEDGKVYNVEITNPGSGYIKAPSVSISGAGTGAEAVVKVTENEKAVNMGVATSTDASAPTKFRFQAPVYLLGDTWYAFVIKAPTSLNYRVYTSRLGNNIIGTENRVSQQPLMGSIFKSQNGGLWTEDQNMDVTFRLNRADFVVNSNARIELQNTPLNKRLIQIDPIEINSNDLGENSDIFGEDPRVIRVHHYNHGLMPDDLVEISGVEIDYIATGVKPESLNNLHKVIDSDINTFTIKIEDAAFISIRTGGDNVMCSYNRPFEVINIYGGSLNFGSSELFVENRVAEASSVSRINERQYIIDNPRDVLLNENYYYEGPRQVANYLNEVNNRSSEKLQDRRSLNSTIIMRTTSSAISPVIDLDRTNATIIRNLINNPQNTDPINGPLEATVNLSESVTVGNITTLDCKIGDRKTIMSVDPVKSHKGKIKLVGSHVRELLTDEIHFSKTIEGLVEDIIVSDAIYFIPETNNNGSVYSKWISRLFTFENPCDGIELKMSAVFYNREDIKVYYRVRTIGFDGDINGISWIPFNGTGLPNDVNLIKPRSSDNTDPLDLDVNDWQSLTWSVQDIPKFSGISIKITMTSDNPAKCPLIDDIRLVCSE